MTEREQKIIDYWKKTKLGAVAIGKHFGFSGHAYVSKVLRRFKEEEGIENNIESPKDNIIISDSDIYGTFNAYGKPISIKEIQEIFKTHEDIDFSEWEIFKKEITTWDVTSWQKGYAEKVRNFRTHIKFRRKRLDIAIMQKLKDTCIEDMSKYSPVCMPIKYKKPSKDKCMLVTEIFDPHSGKLTSALTGDKTYNLKIALKLISNSVEEVIQRAGSRFNITQNLLAIGGDTVNVENFYNATTKGTPQDVSNVYIEIVRAVKNNLIQNIDKLKMLAPVHVVIAPGNHCYATELLITDMLAEHYRLDRNVTIDNDTAQPRKYFKWNNVLIGVTHGNEERTANLPTIMLNDVPELCAGTKYREFLIGHWHREKQIEYVSVQTGTTCIVRVCRSLSPNGTHGQRKGYVNLCPGIDGLVYHEETGLYDVIKVNIKDSDYK